MVDGDREEEWQDVEDDERLVVVMDRACWDDPVGKAVQRLWLSNLMHGVDVPPLNLILTFYLTDFDNVDCSF